MYMSKIYVSLLILLVQPMFAQIIEKGNQIEEDLIIKSKKDKKGMIWVLDSTYGYLWDET